MENIENYTQQEADLIKSLPYIPHCMNGKSFGMNKLPREQAITKSYIQVNPDVMLIYLVFDVDHCNASLAWFDENLPRPYWTTQNPTNVSDPTDGDLTRIGKGHLCYKLEVPVCKSEFGSLKAIKYAQAIYYAYALKLGADLGYTQHITKNPLHPHWRTTYWTDKSYSLDYLADFVTIPKKIPKKLEMIGIGRNVTMFENGRRWAYKAIRDYMHHNSSHDWDNAVITHLRAINEGFEQPLPYSEVRATGRSIAKWVWQRFSYGEFREIQSKRGTKGGKKGGASRSRQYEPKREKAIQMKANGMSIKAIAEELKVHRNSISSWIKEMHK
jgi:hypothetical protein